MKSKLMGWAMSALFVVVVVAIIFRWSRAKQLVTGAA